MEDIFGDFQRITRRQIHWELVIHLDFPTYSRDYFDIPIKFIFVPVQRIFRYIFMERSKKERREFGIYKGERNIKLFHIFHQNPALAWGVFPRYLLILHAQ